MKHKLFSIPFTGNHRGDFQPQMTAEKWKDFHQWKKENPQPINVKAIARQAMKRMVENFPVFGATLGDRIDIAKPSRFITQEQQPAA